MKTTVIYDQDGVIVSSATFNEDNEAEKAHLFGSLNAFGRSWMVVNGRLDGPAASYRVFNGEIVPVSQQAITEHQWAKVRYQRFMLLADSDWRVTRAAESGSPVPAEWVAYRQALRDITSQQDPFSIVWPTPPT